MNKVSTQTSLETIEIEPTQAPVASLIWLHGLGASGDDFVPVASSLQKLTQLPLRFVFPHAPARPVTINQGFVMPAWYDILSFDRGGAIDHEGISLAVEQVAALIEAEKTRGFSAKDIIIAGFSQGAVIALNTLLSFPEELGGTIALSGYLQPRALRAHPPQTPIFIGHGLEDNVVPCAYGQTAYETLEKAGYRVTWKTYAMTHSVCDKEVRDLAVWLNGVLEGKGLH